MRIVFLLAVSALAGSAQVTRLAFRPVSAEYSTALDRILMTSAGPNQLPIHDPVTRTDTTVKFAASR